jgi:hypothetical protein
MAALPGSEMSEWFYSILRFHASQPPGFLAARQRLLGARQWDIKNHEVETDIWPTLNSLA